ncbi:hypothetical protein E4T56_gene11631 [Termitomyces sp. T112]|nr:hypothetical protein E4T56_gene11631 [Termitomyces sp. T112]
MTSQTANRPTQTQKGDSILSREHHSLLLHSFTYLTTYCAGAVSLFRFLSLFVLSVQYLRRFRILIYGNHTISICAQYTRDKELVGDSANALKGPHNDVFAMRQLLLIDCYECLPENIVVLVYTDDPLQTQPTEN